MANSYVQQQMQGWETLHLKMLLFGMLQRHQRLFYKAYGFDVKEVEG